MIKRLTVKEFSLTYASLFDQGMVSLGNFLTQIILARKLPPGEYGVFSLLFGVMFLMNVGHQALIAYPISVRGALADDATLRRLTSNSLLLTAFLAIPLCLIPIGATLVLKRPALAIWIAVALLVWQLQETTRRGLMAHLRHSVAISGDVLSYLGQSIILLVLALTGHLSLVAAFAVIAITSAVGGVVQGLQLGLALPRIREAANLFPSYWKIGKWALMANSTDASLLQVIPWALASWHGLEYAASFQASLNILNITNPVTFGVTNLVVPASLRAGHGTDLRKGWRAARKYAELGFLALFPYYLLVLIWPAKILSVYYGAGSQYDGLSNALRVLVPAYFGVYLFSLVAAFFNGMRRPAFVFGAELAGVATLAASIYLEWSFGVTGACIAFLLVCAARALTGFALLRKILRTDSGEQERLLRNDVPPQTVPLASIGDLPKT